MFRHHLHTRVHIPAPADRVWRVLMDFERYPEWNPFIRQIKGRAQIGQALQVQVQPLMARPMTFKPIVLKSEPGQEFRWLGTFLFKGLLDGEHYFILQPTADGVVLVHGEHFRGALVPLFRRMLQDKTLPGFEAMNAALRQRIARHTTAESA